MKEALAGTPPQLKKILHELGNVKVIRPMTGILFLGSLISGNDQFQDASFTALQAVFLSNLITNGLKLAVGRARPSAGLGAYHIEPFSGQRSFPSGHATTVFAVTTTWLVYYPAFVTAAIFSLGTGTAIIRMVDNYHWLTDVLAGAVIGASTGLLLSRRHLSARTNLRVRPIAMRSGLGINLVVTL